LAVEAFLAFFSGAEAESDAREAGTAGEGVIRDEQR
jgi:hypothetical protein